MSVEADLRAALLAHAPLAAVVGSRVAQSAVAEGTPYPVLVFDVRHDFVRGLDNTLLAEQTAISLQCWAETAAAAAALADLAEDAIEAQAATRACINARSTTFDPDLQLAGVVLEGEWWG